jgi:single-strand DNA-binding protein
MAGKSLNKVMLIGNLGKDPELRYTPNGTAVATYSIATSDSWKDAEGKLTERTEWHNVVAWRKLAEISAQYLKKGQKVYIEGSIRNRNYDDKNGVKRYVTEIVADNLIMLGAGKGIAGEENNLPSESETLSATEKDDLPF